MSDQTNLLEELERRRLQHISYGVTAKAVRYNGFWYTYNGPGDWTKHVLVGPTEPPETEEASA